jgi:hypothetical protein
MRITAMSLPATVLVVGVLGGLEGQSHAEHTKSPATDVAVVDAGRRRSALSTGDLALTGSPRALRAVPSLAISSTGDIMLVEPARIEPFLSASDITAAVAPHAAEIEHCYVARLAAGGHLSGRVDLTLAITRDGNLHAIHTSAPGATRAAASKLDACIRTAVEGLQFPARRNDTTAVVPYLFQKTDAPDAGPQLSCWSPKGC